MADRDFSLHLRGAYLTMHRAANARFAKFGVTADQHVVLTALAQGGTLTQQSLVRACYSDPNTLRAMLVRLERDGLVVRRPHATDGRSRSVALTAKGRRLQAKLAACNAPFQAELESLFKPAERAALLAYLDRITGKMVTAHRDALGRRSAAPDV